MTNERLVSLDVLRGITIVGMILVNSVATIHYGLKIQTFSFLLHAPWSGLTLADLVFPAFIFIMGMSLVFSLSPMRRQGKLNKIAFKKLSIRSLKIIVIGIILSNLYYFSNFEASFFRPFGVLQRISITFFFTAIIYLTCNIRIQILITLLLLFGYIGLLYLPFPDANVDLTIRGANFVNWLDRYMASGHTYVKGELAYDPEGILSTLPTIGQTLLGVFTATYIQRNKNRPVVKQFLIAGISMLILGIIISPLLPVAKEIWSTSFVLITSGITITLFALLYYLLDVKKVNLFGKNFFLAFGVNSILAYVIHYIFTIVLTWAISAYAIETSMIWGLNEKIAGLIPVILFIIAHWYFLNSMRHKNWLVKI